MARIGLFVTAAMVASMVFAVGVASAQTDPYGGGAPVVNPTQIDRDEDEGQPTQQPPVVLDNRIDRPEVAGSAEAPEVAGSVDTAEVGANVEEPAVAPGVLPFTGGDVTLFLLIGAALAVTGLLIVRRTRRGEA